MVYSVYAGCYTLVTLPFCLPSAPPIATSLSHPYLLSPSLSFIAHGVIGFFFSRKQPSDAPRTLGILFFFEFVF